MINVKVIKVEGVLRFLTRVNKPLVRMSKWLPWNDIYEVSLEGNVRNKHNGRILKGGCPLTHYKIVFLGRYDKFLVHRLVATLFLPAPTEPNLEVDHIDRNKHNNHASNLRWVSKSTNQKNRSTRLQPAIYNTHGTHHITIRGQNSYRVQIKMGGVLYSCTRKTLEDAITIRDELIASHGLS